MRRSTLLLPLSLACAFVFVVACGDDDSGTTPIPDGGGAEASPDRSAPDDSGIDTVDARPQIRCTQAELDQGDFTDAGADSGADGGVVELVFNTGANPIQYTNHCTKLKVGSRVTFKGSFLQHPLEPAGGDEPSPIPVVDKDQPSGSIVVELPKAGTFGFQCAFHPLAMFGAIQVVP